MSNISNTDNTIDIRDVIERVEELREQRTHKYVAGWNMPGYMPDSEPVEFDDADDARQYLITELERVEEEEGHACTPDTVWHAAVLRLTKCNNEAQAAEYGETIGRYHYFLMYEGVQGLDADETEELATLEKLLSQLAGYGGDHQWEDDWYPLTLIHDSYFIEAMQELCEEIGAAPRDGFPSYMVIGWEATAENLRVDYDSVDFGDVTYWYR